MVRAGLLGIYGRENPGARHLAPGLLRAVRWRARVAFVVYLWPVTCSNATCWIRGIVTEEGQPVPGAPRLPLRAIATTSRRRSQAHSRGEAWTLSRQRTVTRFFRLKLSRAARRRVYTIGRLCSFPCCLLFWEVREECLCRGFSKRSGRKAFTGKRGQGANAACPAGVCGWALGGRLASQTSALGTPGTAFCMRASLPAESRLSFVLAAPCLASVCLSSDSLATCLHLREIYRSHQGDVCGWKRLAPCPGDRALARVPSHLAGR